MSVPDATETKVAHVDIKAQISEAFKDSKTRFVLELEFVSLLANPRYLQFLCQNRYFEDPKFLNYLEYLLYWKQPTYIKYLTHPHCLYFLELLQKPEFRNKLKDPLYVNDMFTNQFWHWRSYRWFRWKDSIAAQEKELPSPDARPG